MHWKEWKPKLDPQETLGNILAKMPRVTPDKIPWQIWLLENPKSPIAFPGAISLFRHDCIHAITCSSFHPLDEAFVIGFTMGSDTRLTRKSALFFMWLTTWFYPKNYRLDSRHLLQFARGFILSHKSRVRDLSSFAFENYQNMTLASLRKQLGITWLNSEQDYQKWSKRWKPDQFVLKKQEFRKKHIFSSQNRNAC